MKNLRYLLILSLFFFVSCQEDETTETGGTGTAITSISGKLENWTYGTGKTIKIGHMLGNNQSYTIGSGVIAADGSFSVALLPPTSDILDDLVDSSGHFTSTTPGVKVYGRAGAMIYDGSNFFGFALNMNRNFTVDTFWTPTVGDQLLQLVYFSAATTMNGSSTEEQDWDPRTSTPTYITRIVQNQAVAAGWNKVYGTVSAKTSNTFTFTMSKTEPSGLKWYFSRIN